jgi:hypothetical protein
MIIVPAQCKAIEADLKNLQLEKANLEAELLAATGLQKWRLMRGIGVTNRRIAETGDRLNQCARIFAAPYRVDIVLTDLVPGGSVTRPVTSHLWYLTPPSVQTLVESEPAQNDTCVFAHSAYAPAPTGSIGLSVDEEGSPMFNGPLFLSGPLTELPLVSAGRPAPTVAIEVAPVVTIPSSAIIGLQPPASTLFHLNGSPSISLGSGVLTVRAAGTFEASPADPPIDEFLDSLARLRGDPPPRTTYAFDYTLSLDLLPSDDINTPGRVCAVRPLGAVLTGGRPASNNQIAASITQALLPRLELTLNAIVLGAFGPLPAGSVPSVRKFVLTATGVRFFPAVGRFLP